MLYETKDVHPGLRVVHTSLCPASPHRLTSPRLQSLAICESEIMRSRVALAVATFVLAAAPCWQAPLLGQEASPAMAIEVKLFQPGLNERHEREIIVHERPVRRSDDGVITLLSSLVRAAPCW